MDWLQQTVNKELLYLLAVEWSHRFDNELILNINLKFHEKLSKVVVTLICNDPHMVKSCKLYLIKLNTDIICHGDPPRNKNIQ